MKKAVKKCSLVALNTRNKMVNPNTEIINAINASEQRTKSLIEDLSAKLEGRVERVEKRVKNTEDQLQSVDKEMNLLKGELNDLKQRDLGLNIIIKNIPEKANEEAEFVHTITHKILELLNIEEVSRKLKDARRIGKKTAQYSRSIRVVVSDLETKQQIMRNKRKTNLNLSLIVIGNQKMGKATDVIYIDEHLTYHSSRMFKEAREIKRTGLAKYAWTKYGRVYLKYNDNATPMVIRSMLDVIEYKNIYKKRRPDDDQPTGSDKHREKRAAAAAVSTYKK